MKDIKDCDAVILAVAHESYKALTMSDIDKLYADNGKAKVLTDLKGILDKKEYISKGYVYWRL
jgi:UDP-N-acetyl-D-galactosamine dehydrogenase